MDKAEKEIQEILTKYNLQIGYNFKFAHYKDLPAEVKLALTVLNRHGMKIQFTLTPIALK